MQGAEGVGVVEGEATSGVQVEAETNGCSLTGPPGTTGSSSSCCSPLVPLLVSNLGHSTCTTAIVCTYLSYKSSIVLRDTLSKSRSHAQAGACAACVMTHAVLCPSSMFGLQRFDTAETIRQICMVLLLGISLLAKKHSCTVPA